LRAKNKKFCCLVRLPSDPDASILARLIYAEATGGDKIDPTDSSKEMIAIAETAINRADYLVTHPKKQYMFPHTADTIPGVIVPSQYGSLNKPTRFNAPLTPSKLGQIECDFLARAIAAANEALRNPAADPSSSGTFGVRTKGHGGPTGDFSPLPSIPGSNNSFFTLRENQ
jgi:spore germination cell wall hydrolase CwlJ-like protein